MTPVIKVKNIKKTYSLGEVDINAVNGVSFSIEEGEFLSIVGTSGSGKSTLMHIIGLLDKPTEGEVYLLNQNVSELNDDDQAELRNKHIGFVFQSFNLLRKTTALDNVALPLVYAGVKGAERNKMARKALERVNLSDRVNHYSTQLSGGQQQRVAIARALINKPDLILADEPTGNLDTKSGEEIMKLFGELNDAGNTIVLVTHELDIAKKTRRIIEIKDGVVIKDVKNGYAVHK